MKMRRFFSPAFLVGAWLLPGLLVGGAARAADAGFQNAYDSIRTLYNQRHFAAAANGFRELLRQDPPVSLQDNLYFWLGEALYAQQQYLSALAAFERVFTIPRANKREDALIKRGLCYWQLGLEEEACRLWRSLPRITTDGGGKRRRMLRKYCPEITGGSDGP